MWIDRKTYDDLRLDAATAKARAEEQARQIAAQQTTIEWMAIRISQVEKERAQLLFNYTGVKVEVPEVQSQRVPDRGTFDRPDLNALPDRKSVV